MGWWDRFGGAPQGAPQAPVWQPTSYPGRMPHSTPLVPVHAPLETSENLGITEAVAAGDRYRPKVGKVESIRERANCPSCGSPNYFSRTSGSVTTTSGVMPPAPICSECGYNGRFVQTGTDLNAAYGTNTGVPTKKARQDIASTQGGLDYNHPIHIG